ncbi:MAG: HNH endonuclease [Pseudohongiella sp.]|nr:HNH endonuclease [Pseudohongiella sp.]
MAIDQKDIKLLWGRSGNRCALCNHQLTQNKAAVTAAFTLGEQAHIVGEKETAARGKSLLTKDERNSYHNLILLCPTCHTQIDNNADDWPVERLHGAKSKHELWVSETLSETVDHVKLANDIAIAAIVDAAIKYCDLENWKAWSSWAISPTPIWQRARVDGAYALRQRLLAAIWPSGMEEFRDAVITLSIFFYRASEKFMEHAELIGEELDTWRAVRFYKLKNPNPNYDRDVERYDIWIEECCQLIYQTARAANWFADVVRKEVNPMFFLEKGKFIIEEGPMQDLSNWTRLLEFSDDEKAMFPDGAVAV